MITINPRLDSQEIFGFLGGELYYNAKVSNSDKDAFKKLITQHYLPKLEQVLHKDEPDILKEALIDELFGKFSALKLSHYENSDFEIGYKQNYFGKVQGSIDFVLKKDNSIACIFEAKKPNSVEMISANHCNTTALHESILYYLREKERAKTQGQRFEVKYIIITDFYQFFFFKEREFDRFFYQNEYIKSLYDTHKALFKDSDLAKERDEQIRNKDFYKMLGEYLQSENFSAEMKPLCLDLRKINNDDCDIKPFFKAFAPEFLLNKYIHKSEINEAFYKELLYILGLEVEKTKDNKETNKIIPNNISGALYENIAESLHNESDKTQENIISLIILWLNRILFLKLIEANLMRFNSGDKNSVRFLNYENIKDFQTLEKLFFEVLAKPHNERVEADSPFYYLPYLNSSLFSPNKIEQRLIHIQALSNDKKLIEYKDYNKSKKHQAHNKTLLLRYLLEFLDRYKFGSGDEYESDTLINASILGNVFERLNAYKEGSFYTPSEITSYMCEESLNKVIVSRFNSANPKWQCKTLNDIEEEIHREIRLARNAPHSSLRGSGDSHNEAIQNKNVDCHDFADAKSRNDGTKRIKDKYIKLLESIHICDPAVGSGHFLVSALNQMIKIHYDLGLLSNDILNKELNIIADEIHISDFAYTKPKSPNEPSHKIQKELFNLKKSIIQNNLFGVDINPNSVEICKLRLWIELLKNSYYLMQSDESYNDKLDSRIHQMQTLPNIDINIKRGNSLISNIALDITKERLESQLKTELNKGYSIEQPKELEREAQSTLQDLKNKLPKEIERYKEATKLYINETNEKIRATHKRTAESARHFILTLFVKTSNEYATFKRVLAHYLESYGYSGIDDATMSSEDLANIKSKLNEYLIDFNYHKTLNIKHESSAFVERDFIALVKAMKSYESFKTQAESYFEWRFEFPEVLDANGDFMGFDLIIGNPPYGDFLNESQKIFCKQRYKYANTNDVYKLFIEKSFNLIKKNAYLNYIVPITITSSKSNINLHKMLLENCEYIKVSSYGERPVKIFPNAEQKVSIIGFTKTLSKTKELMTTWVNKRYSTQSLKDLIKQLKFINSIDFVRQGAFCKISLPIEKDIMQKLYAQKQTLKKFMKGKEKIYYRDTGNRYYNLFTNYSTTGKTTEKNFAVSNSNAIVALMTSNLFWWFKNAYAEGRHSYIREFEPFPIPKLDKKILSNLDALGKKLQADIEQKANFTDTGKKEYRLRKSKHIIDEIDRLICPLYGLSAEETEFIINYEIEFRTDIEPQS